MDLLLIAFLALLGTLGVLALDALIRRPVAVTSVILALIVLSTAVEDGTLRSVELAGFRVSPADIGFSLVAGAAVLRYLRLARTSPQQKTLVALGAVCVASLLFGISSGPIDGAVNEFRNYLAFVGPALYFSTVETSRETREGMSRAWMWTGVALGILVVLRWASAFGGFSLGIFDTSSGTTLRVIDGPPTLTIAAVALVLLLPGIHGRDLRRKREEQVGAALLLISVVLNRRALWIALVVVLVVLVARDRRVGRRVTSFVVAGAVLFAIAVPLLATQDEEDDSVAVPVTDTDNLEWRLEGWEALVDSGPSQPDEFLVGLPFGTGYERSIEGVERASTPHNFYLQTYLRTGIIGVTALLLVYSLTIPALASRGLDDDSIPFARGHLLLLLVMQVVWLFAWLPLAEQGIILGLAVAAMSRPGYGSPRAADESAGASTRVSTAGEDQP